MHLSVIIPVKVFDSTINACLDALRNSTFKNFEVLLILDGWMDAGLLKLGPEDQNVKVFLHPKAGPAVCRNFGASKAMGTYLAFIDSDVVIAPDSFQKAVDRLSVSKENGLIGAYDTSPAALQHVSRFRNLLHHFHHQKNNGQTGVFWGAFALIDRFAFTAVGGFDVSYKKASIEDVELGFRLSEKGFVVRIHADIQVKHLKRWTILSWMRTDIFLRAKPWTLLILNVGKAASEQLNTKFQEQISALLALINFTLLIASLKWPILLCFIPFGMLGFYLTQRDFYKFLNQHFKFSLPTMLLHHLYFLFASTGFLLGGIAYGLQKITSILPFSLKTTFRTAQQK
jgi:glycosyltransferase involved in cell wall biosynthesis